MSSKRLIILNPNDTWVVRILWAWLNLIDRFEGTLAGGKCCGLKDVTVFTKSKFLINTPCLTCLPFFRCRHQKNFPSRLRTLSQRSFQNFRDLLVCGVFLRRRVTQEREHRGGRTSYQSPAKMLLPVQSYGLKVTLLFFRLKQPALKICRTPVKFKPGPGFSDGLSSGADVSGKWRSRSRSFGSIYILHSKIHHRSTGYGWACQNVPITGVLSNHIGFHQLSEPRRLSVFNFITENHSAGSSLL